VSERPSRWRSWRYGIGWSTVTPWISESGDLLFDYAPVTPPNIGQRRRLLRDEVVWLKARSDSGILGVSPLQRSANAIQHGLATQVSSFT
jgi:phage portal protein BeeE